MTTLFRGGTVYCGKGVLCEAFAIDEKGIILAAGSNEEVSAAFSDAQVQDLGGAFVCAGFHDSHMHVLNLGKVISGIDLSGSTGSLESVLAVLRENLPSVPEGEWLDGRGWNHDHFSDVHRFPNADDLDTVSTTVPIIIVRACGHVAVANHCGLKAAGITDATPDPEGGRIERDEQGHATGVLCESAINIVTNAKPLPDYKKLKIYLRKAMEALNAVGITAVQSDDFSIYPALAFEAVLRAYAELESEGGMTVRVYEQANIPTIEGLERFLNTGLRTGAGTDLFRMGPLKLISDGSLGARTAYLSGPYADMEETRGMPIFSKRKLFELVAKAHRNDMQIAIHAIGDEAMQQVLDAYKALGEDISDRRHGIVHCQITTKEQIDQMREMGLRAYIQPIFLDYDIQIVHSRVGEEMAQSSYAYGTLTGLDMASYGSDCPVERPDPLCGIQCAVTRAPLNAPYRVYRPEEAVTAAEAIDAYTIGSAYNAFAENRLGRIAAGMLADFVVLESNPLTTYPSRIGDIRIRETWMGGKKVYGAKE